MNKNRFRVIYSQARGMFIAVAEIVKSRTKTAGQSSAASDLDSDHISSNLLNVYKKLNPLNFAVVSVLGAVIYTVPLSSIANTQIIADKTAPNSQQPTIINSSNGVTQVNIQTPSAGGVSRNTYTQFDVGQEGAILNNSRNSAQTQIGGWVQGNPWLAKGEAKVILNEVNSSNPSQLKGYLEVAGKSAQVVIANPSGLVCDGCGVINADRFTLTTGQAVMNQGYLESFRVREGQVTIEGKGLNGSLTPYTDIYARALKVNAGLYANSLNVALGQNDIIVKDQATPQINTATSNLSTTSNTPNFALDVGQMGGMYAGKIYLVGTENGLGVRNAGSIHASIGQMILNANGDLMNTGNVIANAGEISIQAHDVKNTGNISNIQQRIQIQAENIQNAGLIVSNDQLQLNVQNGINNTGGELLAANQLNINANELINKGKIIGEGDVDIDLKQSYTHTQDDHIAANGTLKLSTEKEIINQSVLAAGQKLELNAQKIDNQSGASISANETHLIAQDTVHNQGLINGELTHIQADKVWNDGARIYGTHVAIQANRLNNKSNTAGTGAVIASRGDMDLGVGTLNNQSGGAVKENARDNAWILSAGALNIGGSLDHNLKAQGQATAINNLSARIESLGDMTLSAQNINNINQDFSTKLVQVGEVTDKVYIQPEGTATKLPQENLYWNSWSRAGLYRYDTKPDVLPDNIKLGETPIPSVESMNCVGTGDDESCGVNYKKEDAVWSYFNIAPPANDAPKAPNLVEPVTPAGQSSCETGSGYNAQACQSYQTAYTQYQKDQLSYDQKLNQYQKDLEAWSSGDEASYQQLDKAITAYNARFGGREIKAWTQYAVKETELKSQVVKSAAAEIVAGGSLNIEANLLINDKSQILAGKTLKARLTQDVQNIDGKGLHIIKQAGTSQYTYSNWRGGFKRYHEREWADAIAYNPADSIKVIDLPVNQWLGNVSNHTSNQNVVDGVTTDTHPDVNSVSIDFIDLSNSGLFNIRTDSQANYLVETDPAFSNYKKWLSSDYMLNALGLDPAMQQKRLGDGYYEQRLVQDQIAQLTGFRFLQGYGSDENQYQALMNNGLTFAGLYNLRPGVALTAAQIAQLTTDIVWLEEKTVKLTDGSTTKAWVPQVYVKVRQGDLKGDGTLISADQVRLQVKGDVLNGAMLAGREALQITADNISQLNGQMQGNRVDLNTVKDLNNLGGTITAVESANLNIGGNFNQHSTTQSTENKIGESVFTREGLDRKAGLYVTGAALNQISNNTENLTTTLTIRVGGDTLLKGAEIINNNGSSILQTQGNLNVEGVNTSLNNRGYANKDNYNYEKKQQDIGSIVKSTGDTRLQAENITVKGSQISSEQGSAVLSAQQTINILEGRKLSDAEQAFKVKEKGTFSSTTEQGHVRHMSDEAIASSIDGKNVVLDAGTIDIRGSHVISDDLTQIQAKENINITAAQNTYQEYAEYSTKKSGFTASVSDGVASVGYGKSNVRNAQDNQSTGLTQSQIVSLKGNTNIVAGNDLNAEAAILAAGKDINLIGKNVNLAAADIYQDQNSKFESKTSGVSVGITYSSEAAALASAKKSQESNDFSDSAVGKIMSSAETARKATMAATTPVVFTASHQKINNTNHVASTQSVGTEVKAGGNLNIIATEGDIRSQGAKISAEGDALLNAKNNIHLLASSNTETQNADTKRSGFSIDTRDHLAPIGVYNDKGQGNGSLSQSVGTELSVGGKTTLQADTGDINIVGSKVVSQDDLRMTAGKDINIQSAQSGQSQSESQKSKGWGSAQISDTERFDGYMANQNKTNSENITQERSQVGSLDGNVTLNAGNNYNQKVADVVAGKDLNITAKSINILDDHNTGSDSQSSKDLKIGLFSRVSSPLIDLVNAVDKAGKSKADDRTQALQGVAAVAQGYQTYSDIQGGALFKAETGIGFSTSKNSQDKSYSASQSNLLNAGGNINLTSTEGDIHLKNTQVKAKENIALDSAKDILLESGQSQQKADGKNSNAGASYGVGVSVGAQTGAYVFVEAGYGQGSNHLDGTVHENTTLNSDSLSIKSKGDTTLKGAQATANRIDADVGGKLNIISQQDTLAQESEQTGAGIRLQASLGTAWQASGNYSNSKASGSFSSVNEQSGLFSGDGGYHVKADSVDLQGGAIASTASKEKNDLTANSLTFSNLENQSGYKATTVALSGGTKLGQADGESPAPQPTSNTNWKDSLSFSPSLPQQSKDKDSTTTYATLSEGNIKVGGKDTTVEELGIHSDINTANQKVEALPDLDAVLEKQKIIADATSTIATAGRTYSQDQIKKAVQEKEAIKDELNKSLSPEEKAFIKTKTSEEQDAYYSAHAAGYTAALANEKAVTKEWGMGGDYSQGLNAVTTALTAVLGGQTDLQAATNTLAPYAAQVIGQQWGHGEDKNTAAQLAAHAILGATLAYINGGDPTAGGSAAVASEAAATYFTNQYKDKKEYQDANGEFQPNLLPEDVKTQIRDLTAGIGAVIGGAVGDSTYNAQLAGVIGQNAVENNNVSDMVNAHLKGKTQAQEAEDLVKGADELYRKNNCSGLSAAACNNKMYAERKEVLWLATGFIPAIGDIQTLAQAKSAGDVLWAMAGIVPGLGEARNAYKIAEKAGDLAGMKKALEKGTAIATEKGHVNKAKVIANQTTLTVTSKADQNLVNRIAKGEDKGGELTEQLFNSLAKQNGFTVIKGGKYGSNNGFDHVWVAKDGSVTILADSKQITNGTVKLSPNAAKGNTQLSKEWALAVIDNLDPNDPSKLVISNAIKTGKLKTAVTGIDRATGQAVIIPVHVPSKRTVSRVVK